MDRHPLKKYPVVGACGLHCGLCPAYNRETSSRCPGCCGPGFREKHPGCAIITCCVKQRNLETCALCPDWRECQKIGRRLEFSRRQDSLISYRPLLDNFAFIEKNGIEEFVRLLEQKQKLLRHLLQNYNDGRSMSFYCTSTQLLPLDRLTETVTRAETQLVQGSDVKEKARVIRSAIGSLADSLEIDLRLRK